MRRGAVFAFDAMVAAAVVVALILVWASAHSIVLSRAGENAHEELMAAKVAAASDALVKENAHDFSSWGGAEAERQASLAKKEAGLEALQAELAFYGGGGERAGAAVSGGEIWCVSRAVVANGHAAILKACGR